MEKGKELLIKLDDFEGPLDLLLHLIKETKMDIQEVPMLIIVEQYLQFIHSMSIMQLDIAGEYLVMAATLLEIKSRLLLPRVDVVEFDEMYEEDENLEEELVRQLIEYQQFKEVAQVLKEKEDERGQYFTKEPSNLETLQDSVPLKVGEVHLDDVIQAFKKMFQKQLERQPIQAKIEMDVISVEQTMQMIVDKLKNCTEKISIFEFVDSKPTLIATFLAILELAKSKKIVFEQSVLGGDILIAQGEAIHQDIDVTLTSGV
ncbi:MULTISPECIES: segregation/condensation protein A [unclassified Granulicatella]|uniref:segregation/condensation protein A n=1 Tax=unclassified Granulicatella TaxID=2630493 RepID=UPI0010732150|nr:MULTISPECIES: segregation/condensation protein A [unclassified Granulicatella]MBF0780569.1 segregation/condensation protein A [Granulicatella sp. 19428wC4_WM01]TFU94920.1 segregation/condensation protein A [Granulicatella sp. WM01]